MNQPFAVIFDMDGVLVDTNPYHKIAIDQFCNKYGFKLSVEELRMKVYGRTNRQWITNLFGSLSETELEAYALEKEQLFRNLYADHIKPVNGLINFLDQLVTHNIARSIATSAPRANVDFVLERTGTQKYFDIILDERMVTRGKPDPEIYRKSAQALGLPNAQCIVIEDSLSGVEAAKSSGSKVIGITTTHTTEELSDTDWIIHDFSELTIQILSNLIQ
jgi:beta-phosphoglucomutase